MPDAAGISRRRFVGYVRRIDVDEDGTVSFDLHRTEVGQGVNTAVAMVIGEEMGVPVESVRIGQADARPSCCSTSSRAGRTRSTRSTGRCGSPPPWPGSGCSEPPACSSGP
jgi:CO/xanthine dehydrogenase Mo-binding subunit